MTNTSALAEMMRAGVEQAKDQTLVAIGGLTAAARSLELRETERQLTQTSEQLRSDTFNIMVVGRFNNGKSTLLNAVIGRTMPEVETPGYMGPMVIGSLPTTAILTCVRYADTPYVKAWGFNGKSEVWPLERYLRNSTKSVDEEETEARFHNIREFEMGLPVELCRDGGVAIYDSPGLDDDERRTQITQEASARCDAAIVVYSTNALAGKSEMDVAEELIIEGTRVFTVVNRVNGYPVDEQLKGYIWARLLKAKNGGRPYAGDDLGAHDIFFVDAEQARRGRYELKPELVERSGLPDFERRLADFLLRERHQVHLRHYVTKAAKAAKVIEQHLQQRQAAAQTDQAKLRAAYKEIMPTLSTIRSRPAKLPALFRTYRAEAEVALTTNLTARLALMRAGLPERVNQVELQLGKFTAVLQQKKANQKLSAEIGEYISESMTHWAQYEAQDAVEPIMKRLSEDIRTEIAEIGKEFSQIHLQLTGWEFSPDSRPMHSTTERIISGIAGFAFGGLGGAVGGGTAGWRGALGGAAGFLGAGVVLGLVGITTLPVVLPVAMAAAWAANNLAAGAGLEGRLKRRAIEYADDGLGELRVKLLPQLATLLRDGFDELESFTTVEITEAIAEEERNIRTMVEENEREQDDREGLLTRLSVVRAEVGQNLMTLEKAVAISRQV